MIFGFFRLFLINMESFRVQYFGPPFPEAFRGHRLSIFEFFSSIWPLRGEGSRLMPLRKFENRNKSSCLSFASKFHDFPHKPEQNHIPFAKELNIFHVQMHEISSIQFTHARVNFNVGCYLRAERPHSSTRVAF